MQIAQAAPEGVRDRAARLAAQQQEARRRAGSLPRFIMDFSLYRVARALRLLGYDAVCDPEHRFDQVVAIAKNEGRIVVTGSRKAVPQLERIQVDDVRCLDGRSPRRTASTREVMGYDSDGNSEYGSSSSDDEDLSIEEGGTPVLEFVQVNSSNTHQTSLIHILKTLKMEWDESLVFTRCVTCNMKIHAVSRDEVRGLVVDAVFDIYKNFYQCPACKKVFWGVDGGLVINFKALRTIDHMRLIYGASGSDSTCAPTGGALQSVAADPDNRVIFSLRRHFSAFPRGIKRHIFSFLTPEEILRVGEAIPVVRQLAQAASEGREFVPDKEMKRRGKREEIERTRLAQVAQSNTHKHSD